MGALQHVKRLEAVGNNTTEGIHQPAAAQTFAPGIGPGTNRQDTIASTG